MLQDLGIQLLNVSLMLSVGLELDLAVVRENLGRRALLAWAVALNFGLVPLMAWGIAESFGVSAGVSAGMLITAVTPGGATGALLTRMARGSLELSVVMITVFTALALPFVPILAVSLLPHAEVSIGPLARTLATFQVLPLVVGVALKRYRPALAQRADHIAKPASNVIFAVVVTAIFVANVHLLPEVGLTGAAAGLAVVAASLAAPVVTRVSPADRAALSLTTCNRNLALAMLLTSAFFESLATLTVIAFSVAMYALAVPTAHLVRRRLPPPA